MAIDFACGNCGKWFHLDDAMAGLQGRCSGCGDVMPIPNKAAPTTDRRAASHRRAPAPPSDPGVGPMPRRAPASNPIPVSDPISARARARSRAWDPDAPFPVRFRDAVNDATPEWFAALLRIVGTLLIVLGIAAEIARAAGLTLLPGIDGQLLGMLAIFVGAILFALGPFLRQFIALGIIFGIIREYALVLTPFFMLVTFLSGLVFGPPAKDAKPRAPAAAQVARPAAPQPAPAGVAAAPGRDPQPAPIPPPALPRPVAIEPPGPRDDPAETIGERHRRFLEEAERRHERFLAEARREQERIREEARQRQEQFRSRFRVP